MEAAPAPAQAWGAACAACAATMRPGAPWCTLCLAPVQDQRPPAPAPGPALDPVLDPALDPALDPLTAPLHVLLGEPAPAALAPAALAPAARPSTSTPPAWPCTTCGRANDLEAAVCGGCGEAFLSAVAAAEAASLRLPVVGDLRQLTTGQRRMVNVGVGLVVLVVLLALGVLATALG